jgi:hypothetical protein
MPTDKDFHPFAPAKVQLAFSYQVDQAVSLPRPFMGGK